MRIQAAGRGGHGVGRYGRIGSQAILGAVIGEILSDAVAQLLGSRTEVAAARAAGVVAVSSRRWARVKVFVAGELLAKQARTPDGSIGIHDQAAVSLVSEQGLPNP